MSIWCSWEHIGTDPSDGKWRDQDGQPFPLEGALRGNVLSYAAGWSNHYPDLTGEAERPAVIALADIAPWCVPGHDQSEALGWKCSGCGGDHDHPESGTWLRLEVATPQMLSFWTEDGVKPNVKDEGATVVLDEEAARSLRDDLTAWLERPKVSREDHS